jgi:hypothetical protein
MTSWGGGFNPPTFIPIVCNFKFKNEYSTKTVDSRTKFQRRVLGESSAVRLYAPNSFFCCFKAPMQDL